MSLVGRKIARGRRDDFITAKEAADAVDVSASTIKKWLKDGKVKDVEWGRDRNGWILVHRNSLELLRQHADGVKVQRT